MTNHVPVTLNPRRIERRRYLLAHVTGVRIHGRVNLLPIATKEEATLSAAVVESKKPN
jgi:hypothetical protein